MERVAENIFVNRDERKIVLYKDVLAPEDELALEFSEILNEVGIRYVIVAGYVAILFGRSRRSDDIDFIIEPHTPDVFISLCGKLREKGFELFQGEITDESSLIRIYNDYLANGYAVKFFRNNITPAVEYKFAKTRVHFFSLENSWEVVLNDTYRLHVSPLELQIAYKVFLGSEKDVGDAVFLYTLFQKILDKEGMKHWAEVLGADLSVLERS